MHAEPRHVEKLCNPRVVRKNICWPRLDFSEHSRMEIFDGVRHTVMFSYLRTSILLYCLVYCLAAIPAFNGVSPAIAGSLGTHTVRGRNPIRRRVLARPSDRRGGPQVGGPDSGAHIRVSCTAVEIHRLLRRAFTHTKIELFELCLGGLGGLNAVCHACAAAARTPAVPALYARL